MPFAASKGWLLNGKWNANRNFYRKETTATNTFRYFREGIPEINPDEGCKMSMKRPVIRTLSVLALLLLIILPSDNLQAQFSRGTQMSFGKNRVQYNDFYWTFYRFKNFDAYFYVGGQELAIYTGRTADREIEEIERLFDYKINGRFQFVVYNKLSDLKQSNIGLENEELLTNTGGLTKIIGNKVLLYFDGDYRKMREQIRGGVAQVMLNQLMFGGNIKDRLQSAVLLTLPDWYTQGLIAYISRGWSVEADNRLRDGILSGHFRKFNKLTGEEAQFAGHSMWNYIVEVYGQASVSNLLYMTRINRNIESGFLYVLGSPLKQLTRNWLDYYQRIYIQDEKERVIPATGIVYKDRKPSRQISQLISSPDGSQLAFVTNDLGKYKIWLYDIRSKKLRKLGKGGFKSILQAQDLSFPVLSWHPAGRFVTVIVEQGGKLWMDYYHTDKKSKRERNKFFYFEKVQSFNYAANGQDMVMSAVQKGQSDIFLFNVRTRTYEQITKDYWDDIDPHFVMDDKNIIFSSNREEDTLKVTSFKEHRNHPVHGSTDIFLFDNESKSSLLTRLTNTPDVNETKAMMLDSLHFTFVSDQNGIKNRFVSTLESTISYIDTSIHYRYIINSFPVTNYSRNIQLHDVNFRQTNTAELIRYKNRNTIFVNSIPVIDSSSALKLKDTPLRKKQPFIEQSANPVNSTSPGVTVINLKPEDNNIQPESPETDSSKIDVSNYVFQTEFPKKKKKEAEKVIPKENAEEGNTRSVSLTEDSVTLPPPDTAEFWLPKQRNYDIAFAPGYVLTQLDNNLLNETYQAFTGGAVYFDPGLNGLFKIGLNDLMDDYRFVGAFRISGNLNSNEYFLSFENLKHRLDQQVSFYRQGREEVNSFSYFKIHTHELKYTTRWPFNDLASIRGSAAYRIDRIVALSTDRINLGIPNQFSQWGSTHIEYVFDNTISTGLNLYNGFRYKLFGELFRELETKKSLLGVLGADFRYYLKLHRQIIWANRIAASTSFGDLKLIYYLGSTDNAIVPSDNFNQDIRVDYSQNYVFQALATNLRGFTQNIRNGSSFAVMNSEVRVPVFQYILNKPIRSDFIRNFQIIGFGDLGTAWTGSSPYGSGNSLFTQVYTNNPVTITVKKDIEPFVAGYGFGLRSRVLGYFIRGDWAWGYDDGVVGKRIFYFSLGLDF